MKSGLKRVFLDSWLVSFIGVLFLIFLLSGLGGSGGPRGGGGHYLIIVAPFWALLLSTLIATVCTIVYAVYKKRR